jgi:hypothetical protein
MEQEDLSEVSGHHGRDRRKGVLDIRKICGRVFF